MIPASEKRAASRISGGQSLTPILPATNAKLQSRQNRPISSGSQVNRLFGAEMAAAGAMDMARSPSALDLGGQVAIWKLNDRLRISGFSNGGRHARPRASEEFCVGGRRRRLHPRRRARPSHAIDG